MVPAAAGFALEGLDMVVETFESAHGDGVMEVVGEAGCVHAEGFGHGDHRLDADFHRKPQNQGQTKPQPPASAKCLEEF